MCLPPPGGNKGWAISKGFFSHVSIWCVSHSLVTHQSSTIITEDDCRNVAPPSQTLHHGPGLQVRASKLVPDLAPCHRAADCQVWLWWQSIYNHLETKGESTKVDLTSALQYEPKLKRWEDWPLTLVQWRTQLACFLGPCHQSGRLHRPQWCWERRHWETHGETLNELAQVWLIRNNGLWWLQR